MKFLKKVIEILTKPSKREMNLSRAKVIIIEDRRKLNRPPAGILVKKGHVHN